MDYPSDIPTVAVWVTVPQRRIVERCLPTFLRLNTYPKTRLLIACEDDSPSRGWLESLDVPKEIIVAGKPLAAKYAALRARGEDYFYSIQDDWEYHSDPGPMMIDAVRVLCSNPRVTMVNMSSHTPLFLNLVEYGRWKLYLTKMGPVVNFGLNDMQTIIRADLFKKIPDLWPINIDFYANLWQKCVKKYGLEAVTMLKYWGCCIHAGDTGERGWTTEDNRQAACEAKALLKYGWFGERPRSMLYTTALTEEQKCDFVYPYYLAGVYSSVQGPVPVRAQSRLGPPQAIQV